MSLRVLGCGFVARPPKRNPEPVRPVAYRAVMPLIAVDEPFAKPPKIGAVRSRPTWDDAFEVSRGFGEISGADLEGADVDVMDVERLDLEDVRLATTTFSNVESELEIALVDSVVERCDLSRLRLHVVRKSRFAGVKLTGTDFSGGLLRDVEFVDCMLQLSSFRMTELERVTFRSCSFDDIDAYSATLTDVDFSESRLSSLNLDQTTAERVDFRNAQLDGLKGVAQLNGYLIAHHQLPALAYQLADAVGLSVDNGS